MVIPKFARRNGITVHLYVLSVAALVSLALALSISHSTSALLNKIPIVGQPVADIVNGVKDGLVMPITQSVTGLLPQPVGDAVRSPVNALNRAVEPIVGPSSRAQNVNATPQATQTTPTPSPTPIDQQPSADSETAQSGEAIEPTIYPTLDTTFASPDQHTPVLGAATKSFATTKDHSTVIAAGSLLVVIALLFASLVTIAIRSRIYPAAAGQGVAVRRDALQASAIIIGLIVIGSALLYYILSS